MKKYRINLIGCPAIENIEITKETEHYVYLSASRRDKKITEYSCYFDTKLEAKKHLRLKYQKKRKGLLSELKLIEKYINEIEAL